jgi:sugar-specific transcriptional regulator TrmB
MDKEDLLRTLQTMGFKEKEARVYLALLELNEALPGTLSRKTGVKRSTTYLILEQLERKGLASHIKKMGHLYFQACKPELLIEAQTKKYAKAKTELESLKTILPALSHLHQDLTATPQMSVFRGKEGLIQIMEDTLTVKDKMLLCWANTDLAVNTLLSDYHPSYLKKKIKRKIWSKCLFLNDETGIKLQNRSQKELREVRFIPKDLYYFENEINIYDDKMSIISHKDMLGVIIQNEAIANTQRTIFRFAFEYAKSLGKG